MFKKKTQDSKDLEPTTTIDREKLGEAIRKVTDSRVRRFRQEVTGELDDLLDRETRKYRSKVARRSWRVAQKWCKWTEEGPILMPDYARIYYRKGKTEILLIEYPPQVRLLRFRGELSHRENNTSVQSESDGNKIHNYALALPYLVFVFKYVEGAFLEVYVSFNDRPLKNLKARPLRPYLSNIDTTLKLCLGNDFEWSKLEVGNVVQQASFVLSHFWQTVYSDEWGQHYWEYKKHFADDPRMESLSAWQDSSSEDSLFVIDNVDWMAHSEDDYGAMVVRLCEGDVDNTEFQQELYNDVEEELLVGVKQVIDETIRNIEHKIKPHEIEAMTDEILETLNTMIAKEGTNVSSTRQ